LVRNLPCPLACSSWSTFLLTAAAEALPLCALQLAKLGPPLNAPSTSDTVAMPLLAPLRPWVTLKTAPPKPAVWVLAPLFLVLLFAVPLGAAVVSFSVPCSALTTVPAGLSRNSVRGTNLPRNLIRPSPLADDTLKDFPRLGAFGVGSFLVVNLTSGPRVVPALLVATSRT